MAGAVGLPQRLAHASLGSYTYQEQIAGIMSILKFLGHTFSW